MIGIIKDKQHKYQIATEVLADLPEWFGLPESTTEYIECSQDMPFCADVENGHIRGFIALKETSPHTIELYVMGVIKSFHRYKIGENLFRTCYDYAKKMGYSYIQVKTVKEGCYQEYDKTIAFYKALGFKEFECFPTLWDEWNPCQVYAMHIQ